MSTRAPGLQQERTLLAWRRSGLSLFVAALVISRIALVESAPVLFVGGAAGAVLALWVAASALRRGRWSVRSKAEPEFVLLLRDGMLPLAVSVVAGGLCLVVLALCAGVAP
ncbi:MULTISPECIES: DUF202 domain-containing protein [unclassified Nocardioides]|uniref:DUF202 domain-containing protein n=1 Tax=unclassified Nocardioides TaxID=2615069 RepID=UPI0007035922|nr:MULTISPECIES: DUF202 domain-containing protein [unclassified Nocardioides]KQZ74871.1 hypothetical protein ASD66_00310 [Nocardioides sp. Root151]KRF10406.1 hypothetical protein ASH02_20045 [Nocardioides sp. Soil796]